MCIYKIPWIALIFVFEFLLEILVFALRKKISSSMLWYLFFPLNWGRNAGIKLWNWSWQKKRRKIWNYYSIFFNRCFLFSAFPKNSKNFDIVGWVFLKSRQINLKNRHCPLKHPTIEKKFVGKFFSMIVTLYWIGWYDSNVRICSFAKKNILVIFYQKKNLSDFFFYFQKIRYFQTKITEKKGVFFSIVGKLLEKNRRVRLKNRRSRKVSLLRKSTEYLLLIFLSFKTKEWVVDL